MRARPSGHGVVASGVERMASENSTDHEECGPEEVVLPERLVRVSRTGGREAARLGQDRRGRESIDPDQERRERAQAEACPCGAPRDGGCGHRRSWPTRRAISAATSPAVDREHAARAIQIRHRASSRRSAGSLRYPSRRRRLARLRRTAGPTFRLATYAVRPWSPGEPRLTKVIRFPWNERPDR